MVCPSQTPTHSRPASSGIVLGDPVDKPLGDLDDAQHNVAALVGDDGSGGWAVIERYVYTPYGQVQVLNGAADADANAAEWTFDAHNVSDVGNELLFAGYRHMPETCDYRDTGLYHARHRTYSPHLGRFLQRDPAGYADGPSLYAYVGCQPLTYVDAIGLARTKTYQQNTPARSVEDVQRIVSAEQDGKYGPNTRENVAEYQKYLKDVAGTYDGPIDGKWGDATEKAHRAQQTASGKTVAQREDETKKTPTTEPASQPTSGPATTQPAKPEVMDDPSLASYSRRDREAFATKMKQQYEQWVSANPDKLHGACLDSLTVTAQWMAETGWGKREFGHNWGNIKGTGPAGKTIQSTKEDVAGGTVRIRAGFRLYRNNSEFYEDYHKLIGTNNRYKAARGTAGTPLKGKLYYEAIKAAGYATDRTYVELCTSIYKQLGGQSE